MVKCKDCRNLKAYFTASTYCEGTPEKAIDDGERGNKLFITFSHYECTKYPDYPEDQDIEAENENVYERECKHYSKA